MRLRGVDPLPPPPRRFDIGRPRLEVPRRRRDRLTPSAATRPVPDEPATTAQAVADAADVTARQIDHWTRRGWLIPDKPRPGSGAVLSYSATQVRHARLMGALVKAGVTPEGAHRLLVDMTVADVDAVDLGHGLYLVLDEATR